MKLEGLRNYLSSKFKVLKYCYRTYKNSSRFIVKTKNQIKTGISYYIYLSYKQGKIPSQNITRKFPGNIGYHFDLSENIRVAHSVKVVERIERDSKVIRPIHQMKNHFPLSGMKAIFILSSRALYKYHLMETGRGLAETLRNLGCHVDFLQINQAKRQTSLRENLIKNCDLVLLDSEIRNGLELEILSEIRGFFPMNRMPRFAMFIYDLWRPDDVDFIQEVAKSIDIFLHLDTFSVEKSFRKNSHKFHLWPISRSFADATKVNQSKNYKVEPRVFYSGSARQIDRRQILNLTIDICRELRISPRFHVSDPLIYRRILTNPEYIDLIRKSECSISLSQKSEDTFIITGRSVEVLATNGGGVLLQQEGERMKPMNLLLNAGTEYLSFCTAKDLRESLKFISECPEDVKEIAARGHQAITSIFSAENVSKPFLM
jgi:hypothetical protein